MFHLYIFPYCLHSMRAISVAIHRDTKYDTAMFRQITRTLYLFNPWLGRTTRHSWTMALPYSPAYIPTTHLHTYPPTCISIVAISLERLHMHIVLTRRLSYHLISAFICIQAELKFSARRFYTWWHIQTHQTHYLRSATTCQFTNDYNGPLQGLLI